MNNKRLYFIASLLKGFNKILDIGTDHGLVIKYAIDYFGVSYAIASDINIKPLTQAKKNLINYNVDFVISDGFLNVKQEVDATIITGMGAKTIMDILANNNTNSTLILGPNNKEELLRKYLLENNYCIIDEKLIYDDFYYVILIVKKGNMNLNEKEIILGKYLYKEKEYLSFIKHRLNIYENINKLTKDKKDIYELYLNEYKKLINNNF